MNLEPQGLPRWRAALFDLDGTLVDTRPGIRAALGAAFVEATGSDAGTERADLSLPLDDMIRSADPAARSALRWQLSAAFRRHMDDYFVFDGGFARLPEGSRIDFVGMPGGTLAYGCLSETLLLAFDKRKASFARGPLTVAQVPQPF